MKGLVISPVFPFPANTGGLVRIANITKRLNEHFEITFVSPVDVYCGQKDLLQVKNISQESRLTRFCNNNLKKICALFSPLPYHVSNYYEPRLEDEIMDLLQNGAFSFIYCHFIYSLPYLKNFKNRLPVFLDQQNVDREYWTRKVQYAGNGIERILYKLNLKKTVKFENDWLETISCYVSVSEVDKQKTYAYASHSVKNFLVAQNGVDVNSFSLKSYENRKDGEIVLGFMGSLNLRINQEAVRQIITKILPAIRSKLQGCNLSLLVIGRNPPPDLVVLGEGKGVTFTGTVDDVKPYLEQVDILVCPLDGGAGTKLRLFEAMAAGIPVVGSQYMFEGAEDVVSSGIGFVASNIEDYCKQITQLVVDSKLRKSIGLRARSLVEREYSWSHIGDNLSKDIMGILSQSEIS